MKHPCVKIDPATKLKPEYDKYRSKGDKHWFWHYRGYEIHISREKCMAGYSLLYYSIFRLKDGYELTSSYEDSAETVTTMRKYLMKRIDDKIDNRRKDDED